MSSRSRPRYNRVLLKLSGEVFAEPGLLDKIIAQVLGVRRAGVGLALVCGGGNILRGRDAAGMDRVRADIAGMLATVVNGVQLADRLGKKLEVTHLTARPVEGFVAGYSVERGRAELAAGRVLVLSGGTGNPFFSTDSAAALRAAELECAALLKGTNVAGVYSADPKRNPEARLYRRLDYDRALAENLKVMDAAAFALCRERRLPVHIFDIREPGAIIGIIKGKPTGSLVC
ncbi:UMP kinase [candidate division WOR-3 bacterium]|nr:UMP kinase [candidate division WOR-3 bacterium]